MKAGDLVAEYKGQYEPQVEKVTRYLYSFELDDGRKYQIDGDPDLPANQHLDLGIGPYLNDYRGDVQAGVLHIYSRLNDPTRINCEFLLVMYRGEPFVFVIASKPVAANDDLLLDYGESYWASLVGDSRHPLIV